MKGTVCVVTGATSGIGKAAGTALARMGATVVMVGRDRGRTEAAAEQIGSVSASPPRAEIADLASLEQVRGLAGRLAGLERIDVLINNAGLVLGERRITPDGFEHAFARVVTVTSDAHSAARLDLRDPNLEHGWDSWRSYANSKLANILFTRELARRLDGRCRYTPQPQSQPERRYERARVCRSSPFPAYITRHSEPRSNRAILAPVSSRAR